MTDFPKLMRLKSDDENMEKIHSAARKGETSNVQRLVSVGISPVIPNRFGCTALHLACKFGQVETAKYLASISDVQTTWHGQKPIHLAVLSKKEDLVEGLISGCRELGRSVEAMLNECDQMEVFQIGTHVKHTKGQTALHWCVGLGDDFLPMLKLLLRHGASATVRDGDGETALMRAMQFHNDAALDIMLNSGENNNNSGNSNDSPGGLNKNLRLELVDREGRSHLHWAIKMNYEDHALRFIEAKHDVNVEDSEHVVPLYLAIQAAMVRLTTVILERGDLFLVQNAPFHNGTTVLPERIAWLDFATNEEDKKAVIALVQKKLDEILRGMNDDAPESSKKVTIKRIQLAPSAPMNTPRKKNAQQTTLRSSSKR